MEVEHLVLVNADDGRDLIILKDGMSVDLSHFDSPPVNVRAETEPDRVGTVVFSLDGRQGYIYEGAPPYALGGDSGDKFKPWGRAVGTHRVTVFAFEEPGGGGERSESYTIEFTITDSEPLTPHQSSGFGPKILFINGGDGAFASINDLSRGPANRGWGQLASLLEDNGYATEETREPVDFGDIQLADYAVVVFGSNADAYGVEIAGAVEQYVRGGGSALFIADPDFGAGTEDAMASDAALLEPFGWSVRATEGSVRFDAEDFPNSAHAILRDVEFTSGFNTAKFSVPEDATVLVRSGEGAAVALATHGDGRIAGFFDTDALTNAGAKETSLLDPRSDNDRLARNIFRWLTDGDEEDVTVRGELKQWHDVVLDVKGPYASESGPDNPFMDYRLDVTFTHAESGESISVPGYFAADGRAAESGAVAGDVWRAHFAPPLEGAWRWEVAFREGPRVAIADNPERAETVAPHGAAGEFTIGPTDKQLPDNRARGLLAYVGERYPRYLGSEEWFLKAGPGSPENLLAYAHFDGAVNRRDYEPHVQDWREGDPSWRGGLGKGLIGALNYLREQEMNTIYFLTLTLGGDGDDVWPWVEPKDHFRYDVSRLDQWEIVFDHADACGLHLHLFLQEQENDQYLDDGRLGPERRLYHRELIARFSHHLAMTWNIGEENTNSQAQRRNFARHIRELDPYDHMISLHTWPHTKRNDFPPLMGSPLFDAASLQTSDAADVHRETVMMLEGAARAGRPWVVSSDEIGPPGEGVPPTSAAPRHDNARKNQLWGNLMGGGVGVEYLFGVAHPQNDFNADDWRSREELWRQSRIALRFFRTQIPFTEMKPDDKLTRGARSYCLAKRGEIYCVYLPDGGQVELLLATPPYSACEVRWFDPLNGGELQQGTVSTVSGPGWVSIGSPPSDTDRDWLAVVRTSGAVSVPVVE